MLNCHPLKKKKRMYTVVGLNQFLFQGLPFLQLLVRKIEAYIYISVRVIYIVRLLSLSSNNRDRLCQETGPSRRS